MRKVTFGGASSLDNFIARNDDSVDWLKWNREVDEIFAKYWQTVDTVVMGRRTYEVAARMGSGAYPGVKNYVCSRMLVDVADTRIELVREDATDLVRRLKEQTGKGICVLGGGQLARSLFEAELIDEIGFNIHPVLLGGGIPLFYEMSRQLDLELIECTQLGNGCVVLRYRVNHSQQT